MIVQDFLKIKNLIDGKSFPVVNNIGTPIISFVYVGAQ